jgi:protein-S-isoprenylcysteine O-methyltransferase Ste14
VARPARGSAQVAADSVKQNGASLPLLVPALAIALLAIYGVSAFGLRMLVQLRRTGSTGFKGLGGAPGSLEWTPGLLVATAIGLCVAGPVLQVVDALSPVEALDGNAGNFVGAGLSAGGIFATLVAQFAMGPAWRIGVDPSERTALITHGVFAKVRNPIYAAVIVTFAGIVLLAPNPVTIGGALLLVVALELQTRFVEEPYLSRVHGDQYAAYATRVGRFLPGVGRLRPDRTRLGESERTGGGQH